ncbi:MAG: protease HtpX [Leptospiraceae bacterium]|nr:protease HtpX [Leptospiraceae bacterium]MCP5495403.1 protease HtpX [Leptospiraceae bacterium]
MWLKRIGLFLLTNILIITTISIVTSIFGVGHYLTPYGIDIKALLVFCLLWGMTGAFISLALSKVIAKWAMGVKVINPQNAGQYLNVYNSISRLSKNANIPMPEVGVYESPEVNAFATGPSKSSSLVAVSSGLLQQMSEEEVDGVLAHEITHIANGDMVTMTLIQGAVNSFAMFLSRIISYGVSKMVDEKLEFIVRIVVTIALDIVFSILGSIVVAYFSRMREFKADYGAAKLAGRRNMIAALERLKKTIEAPADERGASLASFKIAGIKKGGLLALFSTHPPLDDRINALRNVQIS